LPFFINVEPFMYMKISFICDFAKLCDFFPIYMWYCWFFYLTTLLVGPHGHSSQAPEQMINGQSPQGHFGQFRWRKPQNETESNKRLQFEEANRVLPLVHSVELDRQLLQSPTDIAIGKAARYSRSCRHLRACQRFASEERDEAFLPRGRPRMQNSFPVCLICWRAFVFPKSTVWCIFAFVWRCWTQPEKGNGENALQ
jgi:hypothetical protein